MVRINKLPLIRFITSTVSCYQVVVKTTLTSVKQH